MQLLMNCNHFILAGWVVIDTIMIDHGVDGNGNRSNQFYMDIVVEL